AADWQELNLGTDFSIAFGGINTQGFTLDYTSDPLGIPTPCADMRQKIQDIFDAYYNGVGLQKTLNGSMPGVVAKSSASGSRLAQENYESSFMSVTGAGADVAKNFALMTTFNPYFMAGLNCAYDIADKAQLAQCLPAATAVNQWAEDSAAAGSFFQRIMFHSMNLTLFMFICLAPVVAAMMLMQGIGGLKVAKGYLIFGFWSQSWFVGATIVNFYIQNQLQLELAANNGIGSFTMGMVGPFFMALQDKMALAGDMMASVPLIMMSLITGSVYGLTAISQRVGGADHYNEKVNSADAMAGMTLQRPTEMSSYNVNTGISTRPGIADPTYSLTSSYDNAMQSLNSAKVSASSEVSSSMSHMMQHVSSRANEVAHGTSIIDSMRHSNSSVDRAAATAAHEVMQGMGIKESENVRLTNTLASTAAAGLSAGIDTPLGGAAFKTELSSRLAREQGLSREKSQDLADRMTAALQREHSHTTTDDRSHAFDTSSSNRSVLSTQDSSTAAQQLQTALRKSQSIEQGYQATASMKESGGFGMTFKDPVQFAYASQVRGVDFDKYEHQLKDLYGDKYVDEGLRSATESVTSWGRGSNLASDPGKTRAAAMFEFASSASPQHALMMAAEASGHKLGLDNSLMPQSHAGMYHPESIPEPQTSWGPGAPSGAPASQAPRHGGHGPVHHSGRGHDSRATYSPPTDDAPSIPYVPGIPDSPRPDLTHKVRATKPEMGLKESLLGPKAGQFAKGDDH
ncbi:MAG: hypothetical protein EKK46_11075, partial [Rhodocyclaceae bacterium]